MRLLRGLGSHFLQSERAGVLTWKYTIQYGTKVTMTGKIFTSTWKLAMSSWGEGPGWGNLWSGSSWALGGSLRGQRGSRLNGSYRHHHHGYLLPSILFFLKHQLWDFPGGSVAKNPPANAGDTGSILGPGRSHMLRSN